MSGGKRIATFDNIPFSSRTARPNFILFNSATSLSRRSAAARPVLHPWIGETSGRWVCEAIINGIEPASRRRISSATIRRRVVALRTGSGCFESSSGRQPSVRLGRFRDPEEERTRKHKIASTMSQPSASPQYRLSGKAVQHPMQRRTRRSGPKDIIRAAPPIQQQTERSPFALLLRRRLLRSKVWSASAPGSAPRPVIDRRAALACTTRPGADGRFAREERGSTRCKASRSRASMYEARLRCR